MHTVLPPRVVVQRQHPRDGRQQARLGRVLVRVRLLVLQAHQQRRALFLAKAVSTPRHERQPVLENEDVVVVLDAHALYTHLTARHA